MEGQTDGGLTEAVCRGSRIGSDQPMAPAMSINVTAADRESMDQRLNGAVDKMVEVALRHRTHGVLVTRHGHGHFTVMLSDTVPFGYTAECDCPA